MFPDKKKQGWDFILQGDFSGIPRRHHARRMHERKTVRLMKMYRRGEQARAAKKAMEEFQARVKKIQTDIEFDQIIAGNTEHVARVSRGPRHRATRLNLFQRLYAWWCLHAF